MVEEEPNPDSIEDLIKTVNELLEASFGEGFMGNSDLERNVYGGGIKVIRYDNKLYSIIKFDDLSKSIFYAGKFSKQDGSALQVVETFEDDAKEYIRLYEERFGKPASYEILERS